MAAIHRAARDLVIRIRAERDNEINSDEVRKLLAESSDIINWFLTMLGQGMDSSELIDGECYCVEYGNQLKVGARYATWCDADKVFVDRDWRMPLGDVHQWKPASEEIKSQLDKINKTL